MLDSQASAEAVANKNNRFKTQSMSIRILSWENRLDYTERCSGLGEQLPEASPSY